MWSATVARRKLATLRSLTWRDRGFVAEAAVLLAAARITLRLVPYRWLKRWLALDRSSTAAELDLVVRVRRAIRIAGENVPFQAVCLPQAMAAKVMLARRGRSSSLIVGAGRGDDRSMILHAWLESGGTVVVGGAARPPVTPVVTFS